MSAKTSDADPEAGENERQANKELQEDMSHLASAKDRAQLSSASAMSILDVGVLADVIRRGSGYSMHVPLLVMVSLALLLQIIVGLLSLKISSMKNYYNNFGTARNFCSHFRGCLCFRGRGDRTAENSKTVAKAGAVNPRMLRGYAECSQGRVPTEGSSQNQKPDSETIPKVTLHDIYGSIPLKADESHVPTPYERKDDTGHEPKSFKRKSLSRLRAWVDVMADDKERVTEAKRNMLFLKNLACQYTSKLEGLTLREEELDKSEVSLTEEKRELIERLEETRIRAQRYETLSSLYESKMQELIQLEKSPVPDDVDKQEQLQRETLDIEKRLETCSVEKRAHNTGKVRLADLEKKIDGLRGEKRKKAREIQEAGAFLEAVTEEQDRQEKLARRWEIDEEKFKVYSTIVNDLEKRKVLKRVMFWQNITNYLLYMVFILNMFITSFVLMSEETT